MDWMWVGCERRRGPRPSAKGLACITERMELLLNWDGEEWEKSRWEGGRNSPILLLPIKWNTYLISKWRYPFQIIVDIPNNRLLRIIIIANIVYIMLYNWQYSCMHYLILFLHHPHKVVYFLSILQVRKLRFRKILHKRASVWMLPHRGRRQPTAS